MALNAELLGTTIGSTLFNAIPADIKQGMSETQKTETLNALQDAWKNIASDIVSHITTYAQVTVAAGIAVATTGTESAQSGATTSTGTGTIS